MKTTTTLTTVLCQGHPDKMAAIIADAIVDAHLAKDEYADVECHVLASRGMLLLSGEIISHRHVDYARIARNIALEIGYVDSEVGFNGSAAACISTIAQMTQDITRQCIRLEDLLSFPTPLIAHGYACNESPELMPVDVMLAKLLAHRLEEVGKTRIIDFLRPDGQVSLFFEYANGKPVCCKEIVILAQHAPDVTYKQIHQEIMDEVIKKVIPQQFLTPDTKYLINHKGRYVAGGPDIHFGRSSCTSHTNLYGVHCHSPAIMAGTRTIHSPIRATYYMARYIAKNLVASGLCDKCTVEMTYGVGDSSPQRLELNCYGTAIVPEEVLQNIVREVFDLRLGMLEKQLGLDTPVFQLATEHGHFGCEYPGIKWEWTDKAEEIRSREGSIKLDHSSVGADYYE